MSEIEALRERLQEIIAARKEKARGREKKRPKINIKKSPPKKSPPKKSPPKKGTN
jgi:hypothetical protein